jgi:hypothetical protein
VRKEDFKNKPIINYKLNFDGLFFFGLSYIKDGVLSKDKKTTQFSQIVYMKI